MVDGADRLRTIDFFSGIGGISVALGPWCRTVCYCEIYPHAAGVLIKEMANGNLDVAPVWSNIATFGPSELAQIEWYAGGPIQAITGGFPCQDISCAGKRAGIKGKRSGLFFQQMRIIRMARPQLVFLENVRSITKRSLAVVIGELADCGYDAKWRVLSAQEVGAPHKRDRWWCVAYPFGSSGNAGYEQIGRQAGTDAGRGGAGADVAYPRRGFTWKCGDSDKMSNEWNGKERTTDTIGGSGCDVADANVEGFMQRERKEAGSAREEKWDEPGGIGSWAVEPDVGRVADGVPFRVDRLRGLGNTVVPACARKAFELLTGIDEDG